MNETPFRRIRVHSFSRQAPIRACAGIVFFAALTLLTTTAHAATITVNSTADALTTNGQCTLREALINANNDAATWPDCTAGSGTDTIILPAGTITFAIPNTSPMDVFEEQNLRGDLDITSSMTINGNASGTTINANAFDRVFDVNPDVDQDPGTVRPLITVHINDLTITNGYQNQSGAVRIGENATAFMDNCTVSDSTSWADDGGGVYVFSGGILTMTNCTVSGNSALLLGGGIANSGTLTLISCTITDNTGVHNRGQGVACNGFPCTLRNNIIAGNGTAVTADIEGFINSLGYNIIGKTTDDMGNPIINGAPTTGDQFDTGAAPVNLGALANNGGPTPTHALGAGSIAIDKGESSGLTADQRGAIRPCDQAAIPNATLGDGADIGAFEVQGACVPPNSPPDAVDDSATVEVNSGPNLIDVLNNDTDPDMDTLTITVVTQGAHGSVTNNGTSVSYTPDLNYIGPDSFTYTIDDGNGHTDTAAVTVDVVDTTAPVLTASVATSSLWPPNHELVNVGLSVNASDNSGNVSVSMAVFSDEDDLAPDSGNFSPDAKNIAPGTLRLRSERSGSGDGRVYLIVVTATDASNNVSHVCLTVVVPHSQSQSSINSVNAQAAAAAAYCDTHAGAPPPSFYVVGDGPVVGPKQ